MVALSNNWLIWYISDWNAAEQDQEDAVNVWEDNWDDDNIEDDFSKQLRSVNNQIIIKLLNQGSKSYLQTSKCRNAVIFKSGLRKACNLL